MQLKLLFIFCPVVKFTTVQARGIDSTDTTYTDYFKFRTLLYAVHIKQVNDRFELSLKGPKLAIRLDSSTSHGIVTTNMTLLNFDSTESTSSSRDLPINFSLDVFKAHCYSLLTNHIATTNATTRDMFEMIRQEQPLSESLSEAYSHLKQNHLTGIAKERENAVSNQHKEEVRALNVGHKRTIDSLLNIIDIVDEENRYGGQFELTDHDSTGIPIYYYRHIKGPGDTLENGRIKYPSHDTTRLSVLDTNSIKFYPTSIVIKTFNNFIDQLLVNGNILFNDKLYPVRFYNGTYSIPLKHLFTRTQYLPFTIDTKLRAGHNPTTSFNHKYLYYVNISDLIGVNAYNKHFTFMVKNDAYRLTRRDSIVRYERRSFYDYLNFTTFLDFLGVQEKTPNSLIQIEGRVRLPLKLTNSKFLGSYANVWFPKIDAYLNAAFVNGSQDDSRFGTIYNRSKTGADLDSLYIDNFDLLRKYNIRSGIELGLYKRERKNTNLNFYLDYALHFWRTSLQYTIVDSSALDIQERFNAWSWSHGPIARVEFRPDQNIGADFSFATNFNQRLVNTDNDNLEVVEVKGPLNRNLSANNAAALNPISNGERINYKVEMNVYFMVNPSRSNGGLYFRLSNYFNYNFKQMFPQVLVGYATRLSGMVKNIRDKAE